MLPLRFPCSRVLLPRTRLAYIHLHNLLNDAKRDRAARISGFVSIALPEELVTLYLLGGELVNATIWDGRGSRATPIAAAIDMVPAEPEYGEISFSEADEEQLDAMFAAQTAPPEPWPDGLVPQNPSALFPYLMSTTFDGVVEIIAGESVNYLIFRHGAVARVFLGSSHHGTMVDRVAKLFAREGRIGELRVLRWGVPEALAVQAPPALVQAYRELASGVVHELVAHGRESAPVIAEHARLALVVEHPALDAFSFTERPPRGFPADSDGLTAAVAAWLRDFMWAAVDHDSVSPEELLKQLAWDRRHVFQSAGLFDRLPWKVM